jgi:hypothetical protein
MTLRATALPFWRYAFILGVPSQKIFRTETHRVPSLETAAPHAFHEFQAPVSLSHFWEYNMK